MIIVATNPNHDGSIAIICDNHLESSLEAEKNSHLRHQSVQPELVLEALGRVNQMPDALALAGWHGSYGGYFGVTPATHRKAKLMGKEVWLSATSHERTHIMSAYALSPFPQGTPCYALVWEGTIGTFYYIDEQLKISPLGTPLTYPGWRYSYGFYLGSSTQSVGPNWETPDMAGKLMALAGRSTRNALDESERKLLEYIVSSALSTSEGKAALRVLLTDKQRLPVHCAIINGGHENEAFRNFAAHLSDAIYDRFLQFALKTIDPGKPMIISGGCGLNCEWNSRWRATGLFSEVFIPPCTNDTGSAIGAAVDAQFAITGNAKLTWNVYSGQSFEQYETEISGWSMSDLDSKRLAALLLKSEIVAWIQGRCEIGPRALGNRSLLASPFDAAMRDRLNAIKMRESYRPIAPVCLQEDAEKYFEGTSHSPFMLHFHKVKAPELKAITHDDGSARAQTVTESQNSPLWHLLREVKAQSGFGVLCNTSLNKKGKGFINNLSDSVEFAEINHIRIIVIDNRMFIKNSVPPILEVVPFPSETNSWS